AGYSGANPGRKAEAMDRQGLMKGNARPYFSPEIVKEVLASLPEPQTERRHELLPQILDEWSRTALREYLSREAPTLTQGRVKTEKKVASCARELLKVLNAVDKRSRTAIVFQMINSEGRRWEDLTHDEMTDRRKRLDEECDFLARLAEI